MTQQFILFWMNKNLNLSEYSPDELQSCIKKHTKYILNNMDKQPIKKCWDDYANLQKTFQNNHDTFWLRETQSKQHIHYSTEYLKVRSLLKSHENILIFTGAGMSSDSGLPVFRKDKKTLFTPDFSNTEEIRDLFDSHEPHSGYNQLLAYCKDKEYFVMTSNIDGYFSRSGFDKDRVVEIHGNVYNSQCSLSCHNQIYDSSVLVCPQCDENMRPNVLMFGDEEWINRTENIDKKMVGWIDSKVEAKEKILIIEIGVGIHIPTVRDYSEILMDKYIKNISLIRVNPEYWEVPQEYLKISGRVPMSAIEFFKCFI